MIRIRLEFEGEVLVDRLIAGIESRASDFRPVWPDVVRAFRTIAARAFATEGESAGGAWPELAERTQRDREREGYNPTHPILQRTQRLMRSLTLDGGEGFANTTATSLEIGSNVEYFKYHQSNKPRTKIPRRPVINLTADDRVEIMRPIRLYLTGRGAFA